MELTYSTDKHDFYAESDKYRYLNPKWVGGLKAFENKYRGRLFNIVPKGANKPTGGYFQPAWIMKQKGYIHLSVREVFDKYFCECDKCKKR